MKASVYWLHWPEHTDIFSQGYIGVTRKEISVRLSEHTNSLKQELHHNHFLQEAYSTSSNILQTILLIGSEEYCYEIERKLRPFRDIGWNIATGGATIKGLTYEEIYGDERAIILRNCRTQSNINRGPRSKSCKQKISQTRKEKYKLGQLNIVYSEEFVAQQGDALKINREETCYKCGRIMTLGNLKRWHNEKCIEGKRKYANS